MHVTQDDSREPERIEDLLQDARYTVTAIHEQMSLAFLDQVAGGGGPRICTRRTEAENG